MRSGAAQGEGAFAVTRGMRVFDGDGAPIGRVREVVADSRGRVEQVIVQSGNTRFPIPAGDLSASGNALVAGEGNASAQGQRPSQSEPETASDGEAR
ncbi:PRC-barrel domain-containing protein [Leptolyngbya sp. 15MV]|nr:PRC-barrel domain-containing protein [Leptolyngbya sp. 15MV]